MRKRKPAEDQATEQKQAISSDGTCPQCQSKMSEDFLRNSTHLLPVWVCACGMEIPRKITVSIGKAVYCPDCQSYMYEDFARIEKKLMPVWRCECGITVSRARHDYSGEVSGVILHPSPHDGSGRVNSFHSSY